MGELRTITIFGRKSQNRILEQLGDRKLTGPLSDLRPPHTIVIVPRQDLRSVAAELVRETRCTRPRT